MLNIQDRNSEAAVAMATPVTPIPKPAVSTRSRTILVTQEMPRNNSEEVLFPRPRKIPALKLYPILPRMPNVVIRKYTMA